MVMYHQRTKHDDIVCMGYRGAECSDFEQASGYGIVFELA